MITTYLRIPAPKTYSSIVVAWAVFAVVVFAVIGGIALFGTVPGSVWEPAAQVPRWGMAVVTAWSFWIYLPAHVAHGTTRREFLAGMSVFTVAGSGMIAALTTAGYVAERLLYQANGWDHTLTAALAPTSAGDTLLLFAGLWLTFVIWSATGAFLAAVFYRRTPLAIGAVPLGAVLLGSGEVAIGAPAGPFLGDLLTAAGLSGAAAVALCVAVVVVVFALLWLAVRDIPLRTSTN
ncbi:hypothetical protein [Amycolatopsis suaedae]|uniref:Uncharacterized protein n=1 Tax=Amycolatopsis suaedae TaxID=2510978 RepID=A0A4Q7J5W1_9PSEU|nr:hypothetical protein [Amycolatopsis suaedae]RZQ62509.1 hypothetical protein EWH70_19870 [Amycolatopsis suaedae]